MTDYGIMNFNVYPMIIPKGVKSIYILTEDISYLTANGDYKDHNHGQRLCPLLLLNGLVPFLQKRYPETTIAVRRGKQMDGFVQINRAKLVICTATTFCFWPAVANSNSDVYFMQSGLIPPFYFGDRFHWISYPKYFGMRMHGNRFDGVNATETVAKRMIDILSSPNPRNNDVMDYYVHGPGKAEPA